MRYVIIGTGAIGGVLGTRLALAGGDHPPVFVARGDNAAALKSTGARVRSPDDDATTPVTVVTSPDEIELLEDDVLVLATKTHQADAALADWVDRPVTRADGSVGTADELLPVFTALNGVQSERIAARLFRRVFGVTVWLPAVHLTPGEFVVRIAPVSGVFIVGRYGTPADDADRALLATVKSDWEAASFLVPVVDDVMRWKYQKLISNLGNAVQALLGEVRDPVVKSILQALKTEALDEYAAAGIQMATDEEEAELRNGYFDIRPVPGVEGELGGSSWQSMARGSGTIETDYLNGEIALIAREHGRDAPVNSRVAAAARRAARSRRRPGEMSPRELATELGIPLD